MARRNPDDPLQVRIAVHELGHALAWKCGEVQVVSVTFAGQNSECHVRVYDEQWREFAIGLWAGYEAEAIWGSARRLGGPSRGNSAYDIKRFREVTKGHSFSEGKARAEARRIVHRHIDRIEALAPKLITAGRLSGGQL